MSSKLWTWEKCGQNILTLQNRHGFNDSICFLDYCIKKDGTVRDLLNNTILEEPETLYWLLTHYAEAESVPLTNELIPYNKLPGGYAYFGAFRELAINPLVKEFGNNINNFKECCLHFEGKECSFGDSSFVIPVLPLVPITLVLWEKTEEFSARCSVLYDSSASEYLPTEDLAHLGELLTHRLITFKEYT
ncbi:MAG: DUF3786 domain-containing protein [Candidatus Methanofastidiosia archaeon]